MQVIEEVNWEQEFEGKSGVECLEVFYEVVRRETERCIPKKVRRKSSSPLWMSGNIIRMIRKKRRLWQNYTSSEYYRQDYGSFQAYKEVEKRVKAEVKKAKRKFERKLAKQSKKNSKQFYSYPKKTTSNRVSVGPHGLGTLGWSQTARRWPRCSMISTAQCLQGKGWRDQR